ncbi:hypothetical protein M378DRAFT_169566 [Amanita muscaria Koide BX008]|uniref:Uncharacterized protein n=1 Tax=Amanita muscaria (strain Koide BX008) TaxID=946122 RepID=A0A0C2WS79_AMAMK|nr:hypothetical protein M378DRAFT_169566 [Amanita muscaria Koide BX008]
MSSSSTLDAIIPIFLELAKTKLPISQAIDAAVQINTTANNVKTDRAEFAGLGEDAAKLVYVVEAEWREKLNALNGVLGKISELTQKNAALTDRQAFWHNDEDGLQALREELQQLLPVFGIMSFTDLQTKSDERIKDIGNNTLNTSNVINAGMSGSSTSYGTQFFPGANNATITGGELNNVGRDYNRTNYRGKNIGASYGPVSGQSEDRQPDDGASGSIPSGQFLPGASNSNVTGGEFNNVGRDYNKTSYQGQNIGANYGTVSGQSVVGDSTSITMEFPAPT